MITREQRAAWRRIAEAARLPRATQWTAISERSIDGSPLLAGSTFKLRDAVLPLLDALDEMERERDQLAHLRMDHCIALQLLSSSETRGPILVTGCADASRNGAYEFRDGRIARLDKCEA